MSSSPALTLRVVKKAILGSRWSSVSIQTEYTMRLGSHCAGGGGGGGGGGRRDEYSDASVHETLEYLDTSLQCITGLVSARGQLSNGREQMHEPKQYFSALADLRQP